MSKLFTIPKIKLFMNALMVLVFIMGSTIIITKSYLLFFRPNEIDILRIDIPWNNPISPVTVMLDKNMIQNDPELFQKISKNIFTYDLIKRFIFIPLLLLILIQLKKFLIAIKSQTFFELRNILTIRNLSILVGAWVVGNFVLYQVLPLFIPENLIIESINFVTFKESPLSNILISIDFKMLMVALMLYIISILFKEGYLLKEQTDLTI